MKNLLLVISIGFIILSCSKSDKPSYEPVPKLTTINWVMSGWKIEYDENGESKILDRYNFPELSGINDCILDDSLIFNENRTYETNVGIEFCNPAQALWGNGKWEIENNVFSLEPTGYDHIDFTLIELSDTLLSFSRTVQLAKKSSDIAIETFSYKH